MPEIVVLALRVGLLALLWLFVLAAVRAVRTDLRADPERRPVVAGAGRPGAAPDGDGRSSAARRVVVVAGPLAGTSLDLEQTPVTFGRSAGNALVLDDDYVSGRHARLSPSPGAWVLEDLGSTNGTFLGTERVGEPVAVPLGVPVRMGRTVLELRRAP